LVEAVKKEQTRKFKSNEIQFPNEKLIDQFALIGTWWKQLDPLFLKNVSKREFTKFILQKGMIRREPEIERLIKGMINEPIQDKMVKESQFKKIFMKPMLKGAIMNIHYYVTQLARAHGDAIKPVMLKVLKFQRKLLFGGMMGKDEKFGVNCSAVLEGIIN
jgi:hypothetical protein